MEITQRNAEIRSIRLGSLPKDSDMKAAEFKARISAVLAFVAPNATIKAAYPKAAAFLGIGPRRVRALHASEARTFQVADDEALFEAEVRMSEHFIEKEAPRHADRLEYAALRYAAQCPDTHRDRITRLRDLARRVRRSLDREGEA